MFHQYNDTKASSSTQNTDNNYLEEMGIPQTSKLVAKLTRF